MIAHECVDTDHGKSIEHVWSWGREADVSKELRKSVRDIVDLYFDKDDVKLVNGKHCLRNQPTRGQK